MDAIPIPIPQIADTLYVTCTHRSGDCPDLEIDYLYYQISVPSLQLAFLTKNNNGYEIKDDYGQTFYDEYNNSQNMEFEDLHKAKF